MVGTDEHFIVSEQYRHQVFQLLRGDVFDRDEAPVLQAMQDYIEAVEKNEGHLLRISLDPNISLPTL